MTMDLWETLYSVQFEIYMKVFFGVVPLSHEVTVDRLLSGDIEDLTPFRVIESLHYLLTGRFPDIKFDNERFSIQDIMDHRFYIREGIYFFLLLPYVYKYYRFISFIS